MTLISRRAVLKGAAAVPVGAHLVAQDMKLRMAGLNVVGFSEGGCDEVAGGNQAQKFTSFVRWFKEVGEESLKRRAKEFRSLDPDIVEMCSPSLQAKMKMQERRNYRRILADKKDWFERQMSLKGFVNWWN